VSQFRIASICPSNTELVFALGLGEYLVGVDNYSDFPADALANLPRLGPDLHIDVNLLTQLKPDLVVSSLSVPGMERVVEQVKQAGLQQIVLSPHTMADIYTDLQTLASVVPDNILASDTVQLVLHQLRTRVERVRTWTASATNKPRIYWEWWPSPVFSPAKGNWLTEVSELAGAVNIFGDVAGDQVQDDGQRVADAAPEYFLAVWTGIPQNKVPLEKILARPEPWQSTPMFQNHALYILSEGLFCRPSPRLIDGLEQLVGLLHPTSVSELRLDPPSSYAPIRTWTGDWL